MPGALLDFALALAGEADEISMSYFRHASNVRTKADGTLVTDADEAVEQRLRVRIGERFPKHAILGEEQGAAGHAAERWVLDPIDGTHNFARGVSVWATLIAFERDGLVEMGVVSAPAMGVRWWATRGGGAFRSTRGGEPERLAVSELSNISGSQVLYGSYRHTVDGWPGADRLLRQAWRTRGFGDFWAHCLVAEGSAEVMMEPSIKPWDLAPLILLIEEAGGRLTDIDGNATIHAGNCVSTNGVLHVDVLRTLKGGSG